MYFYTVCLHSAMQSIVFYFFKGCESMNFLSWYLRLPFSLTVTSALITWMNENVTVANTEIIITISWFQFMCRMRKISIMLLIQFANICTDRMLTQSQPLIHSDENLKKRCSRAQQPVPEWVTKAVMRSQAWGLKEKSLWWLLWSVFGLVSFLALLCRLSVYT